VSFKNAAAECERYGVKITSVSTPEEKFSEENVLRSFSSSSYCINGNFHMDSVFESELCADPQAKFGFICEFKNIEFDN
jgi:hypothetical protein